MSVIVLNFIKSVKSKGKKRIQLCILNTSTTKVLCKETMWVSNQNKYSF